MTPGSGDLIRELEDGVALLIYDLPSPEQGLNASDKNDERIRDVLKAWKAWYEKVRERA